MQRYLYLLLLIVVGIMEMYSQPINNGTSRKWIPFTKQSETAPTIDLTSSSNDHVSLSVQVNGMSMRDKKIGDIAYQQLTIPNSNVMSSEGFPNVPMIAKLIAIPDCDDISILVDYTNQIEFSNINIPPSPKLGEGKGENGEETTVEYKFPPKLTHLSR
jgi:hypothetical protein